MKDVFEFDKDFATDAVIHKILGRLHLQDGGVIRLLFGPQGFHVMVPRSSVGKSIRIIEDCKEQTLGTLPEEGVSRRCGYCGNVSKLEETHCQSCCEKFS